MSFIEVLAFVIVIAIVAAWVLLGAAYAVLALPFLAVVALIWLIVNYHDELAMVIVGVVAIGLGSLLLFVIVGVGGGAIEERVKARRADKKP